MSTPGSRPAPTPPRPPMVAWWVWPLVLAVFVATATVPLAGAPSGLLAGHGFAWPSGPFGAGGYKAVFTSPADPAAAWPSEPVPGGPVLTWLMMAVCFVASGALAGVAESIAQRRAQRKHEKHSGLGDDRELVRLQMNERGAAEKARQDFGSLADRSPSSIDSASAATYLGDNVIGGSPIFLQHRDCVLCFAQTGAGKTARLAVQRCWDAPGFLLATSTKRDLVEYTYKYRSALGRVEIFDPENLIGHPHPMRWSLLSGCTDERVATRRAEAWVKAVPMGDTKDASFWQGKAQTLMRCYLYAAAAEGLGLQHVRAWVTNRRATQPLEILDTVNASWAAELRQIVESDADSSEDMFHAVSTLVAPLSDPRLMAAVDTPAAESVDLAELVLGGPNTLYLLSDGTSGSVAPIVAVLASEVHHLLNRHSQRVPGRRLDPPARLVLDEVNTVAPIPGLPGMINDIGGRGISIWAFAHNRTQMHVRWGQTEGDLFINSAPVRIVLAGMTDDRHLEELSSLSGTIEEYEPMIDPQHPPRLRTRRVLEKHEIRQLESDQGLMITRGAAPFLVHLPTVFARKQWKREIAASTAAFEKVCPSTGDDTETTTPIRRWA